MRSCEYIKVTGKRKTKLLTLNNVCFFKCRKILPHSDPFLHLADCVSITSELQKHDTKNDIITQHRSSDPVLCPVKIWSKIVCRIRSYESSSGSTTVNTFIIGNNKTHLFTGSELLKRLRFAATSIGPDILGFTAEQLIKSDFTQPRVAQHWPCTWQESLFIQLCY
jgi:hypothetical protein